MPLWMLFLIVLGVTSLIGILFVVLTRGFWVGGPLVLTVIALCVALASVSAALKWKLDRRRSEFLHIDKRRGVFSFPAAGTDHRIDAVKALELRSRDINMAINEVPQWRHTVYTTMDEGEVEVFAFRGSADEGDPVTQLISEEMGL